MKAKYVVGIAIILFFIGFASVNFQQSLVTYVSMTEAKEITRTVQVKGAWVPGSERFDGGTKTFNFRMTDDSGEEMLVMYSGVKPSNFEQAKEVVARGRYSDGVFHADDLLVKCPSKYEAEGVGPGMGEQQS